MYSSTRAVIRSERILAGIEELGLLFEPAVLVGGYRLRAHRTIAFALRVVEVGHQLRLVELAEVGAPRRRNAAAVVGAGALPPLTFEFGAALTAGR